MKKITTKEYLQSYSVSKDGLSVNKSENEKISTRDYLTSKRVDPILALKVEQIKQNIAKQKIHNMLRMLFTFLLVVSFSPWSSHINIPNNIQYVLTFALGTDLCGFQIVKK